MRLRIVYTPQKDDCVIGVITDRFSEEYEVDINAAFTARLNHVAFEGATKRNKPMLKVGCSVARGLHLAWLSRVLSSATGTTWNGCATHLHSREWSSIGMGERCFSVWRIERWLCL